MLAPFAMLGCGGGGGGGRACSGADPAKRPAVQLSWEVAHGSLDDDPPRSTVTLRVRSGAESKEERIKLGVFEGVCTLGEMGALPDNAVEGSAITELRCHHAKRTMIGRVVVASSNQVGVRRFQVGDAEADPGWEGNKAKSVEGPKNEEDLGTVAVPQCAHFTAEIAQESQL